MVIDLFSKWQQTTTWKPERYYKADLIGFDKYQITEYQTKSEPYEWHVMGMATDQPYLNLVGAVIPLGTNDRMIDAINNGVIEYYPVYVELSTAIPARECVYETYDLYMTNFKGRGLDDENFLNYSNYMNYNVFIRNVEKDPTFNYITQEEFDAQFRNYLLLDEIIRLKKYTVVPLLHWPEMLFTDKHYDDVPLYEYIKGGPAAPYPSLGYYPPKREIFEDPMVDDYVCPTDLDYLYNYHSVYDAVDVSMFDPAFLEFIDSFMEVLSHGDYDLFLDFINTKVSKKNTLDVSETTKLLTELWNTYKDNLEIVNEYLGIRRTASDIFP